MNKENNPPRKGGSLTARQKKEFNLCVRSAKVAEKEQQFEVALLNYRKAANLHGTNKLSRKVELLEEHIAGLKIAEDPREELSRTGQAGKVDGEVVTVDTPEYPSAHTESTTGAPTEDSWVAETQSTPTRSLNDEVQESSVDEFGFKIVANGKEVSVCLEQEGGPSFMLPAETHEKLYGYQREGLLWMWKLHQTGSGGILGDDMGLGKTVQVCSFLKGISHFARFHMIVAPVSVIEHWKKELKTWYSGYVGVYHGGTPKARTRELAAVKSRGGVLVTTYGMVTSRAVELSTLNWNYIILDEGHKIKNPTRKIAKQIRIVPAAHKLLLSGTPIQNNLVEAWALFDYVTGGDLFGSSKQFKERFENVIVRGLAKDATEEDKGAATSAAALFQKMIEPHFLRREKSNVLRKKSSIVSDGSVDSRADDSMPRKNDFIVWIRLTDMQLALYRSFVGSDEVAMVLNKTRSALAALTVLKKICDHPRLLANLRLCHNLLQINEIETRDPILCSGKMLFLRSLLPHLSKEGHRVLVFSQSKKMLDIIQTMIINQGEEFRRIDGSVLSTVERQRRIDEYNSTPSIFAFLLTTQAGGVGINLTGADRVVIVDPQWNPAADAQAVDRAYRLGQKRNVVVYRLITCGTIEEKIYRKQVFKDTLMKAVTKKGSHYTYFTRQELRALFELDDPNESETQKQLAALHASERVSDATLDMHLDFIHSLGIFGISDHNLLFSKPSSSAVPTTTEDYIIKPDYGRRSATKARKSRRATIVFQSSSKSGSGSASDSDSGSGSGSDSDSDSDSGSVSGSGSLNESEPAKSRKSSSPEHWKKVEVIDLDDESSSVSEDSSDGESDILEGSSNRCESLASSTHSGEEGCPVSISSDSDSEECSPPKEAGAQANVSTASLVGAVERLSMHTNTANLVGDEVNLEVISEDGGKGDGREENCDQEDGSSDEDGGTVAAAIEDVRDDGSDEDGGDDGNDEDGGAVAAAIENVSDDSEEDECNGNAEDVASLEDVRDDGSEEDDGNDEEGGAGAGAIEVVGDDGCEENGGDDGNDEDGGAVAAAIEVAGDDGSEEDGGDEDGGSTTTIDDVGHDVSEENGVAHVNHDDSIVEASVGSPTASKDDAVADFDGNASAKNDADSSAAHENLLIADVGSNNSEGEDVGNDESDGADNAAEEGGHEPPEGWLYAPTDKRVSSVSSESRSGLSPEWHDAEDEQGQEAPVHTEHLSSSENNNRQSGASQKGRDVEDGGRLSYASHEEWHDAPPITGGRPSAISSAGRRSSASQQWHDADNGEVEDQTHDALGERECSTDCLSVGSIRRFPQAMIDDSLPSDNDLRPSSTHTSASFAIKELSHVSSSDDEESNDRVERSRACSPTDQPRVMSYSIPPTQLPPPASSTAPSPERAPKKMSYSIPPAGTTRPPPTTTGGAPPSGAPTPRFRFGGGDARPASTCTSKRAGHPKESAERDTTREHSSAPALACHDDSARCTRQQGPDPSPDAPSSTDASLSSPSITKEECVSPRTDAQVQSAEARATVYKDTCSDPHEGDGQNDAESPAGVFCSPHSSSICQVNLDAAGVFDNVSTPSDTTKKPASPTACCTKHHEQVAKYGWITLRCRCYLTPLEEQKFNYEIMFAKTFMEHKRADEALIHVLTALDVCSDDPALHALAIRLGRTIADSTES